MTVGTADRSLPQPRRQRRPIICGEFRRFEEPSRSNLWRLGSCSIRRQQVAVGPADRQSTGNSVDSENSGTRIYGSRIRRQNPRQQAGPGTARSRGLRPSRALRGFSTVCSGLPSEAALFLHIMHCFRCISHTYSAQYCETRIFMLNIAQGLDFCSSLC